MATTYKTPGVYVEEIPKFPPSVAPVDTAIPAFIGYTEKAQDKVGRRPDAQSQRASSRWSSSSSTSAFRSRRPRSS